MRCAYYTILCWVFFGQFFFLRIHVAFSIIRCVCVCCVCLIFGISLCTVRGAHKYPFFCARTMPNISRIQPNNKIIHSNSSIEYCCCVFFIRSLSFAKIYFGLVWLCALVTFGWHWVDAYVYSFVEMIIRWRCSTRNTTRKWDAEKQLFPIIKWFSTFISA